MKIKGKIIMVLILLAGAAWLLCSVKSRVGIERGAIVDSLHGVYVYHNGHTGNVSGRNFHNGYMLGLKYQCVEFVKRYFYEHYDHKMPNVYGHAKDFFIKNLPHGKINKDRDLMQYHNGGNVKPKVGDLIVFDATVHNKYGHVAIVSDVKEDEIEIIQQNYGPFLRSRKTLALRYENEKWNVENSKVLGWLRYRY